jgi:hypothetical protein
VEEIKHRRHWRAVAWSLTATAVIALVWAPITLRLYSKQG